MYRNLIPSKNQLQTDNLISSSSYFEDSSEDEGYLLRNEISKKIILIMIQKMNIKQENQIKYIKQKINILEE